jgi:hypothetical protein
VNKELSTSQNGDPVHEDPEYETGLNHFNCVSSAWYKNLKAGKYTIPQDKRV